MTVYHHVDAAQLTATASGSGHLPATAHQVVYYKE
jgi:hypothetical protein